MQTRESAGAAALFFAAESLFRSEPEGAERREALPCSVRAPKGLRVLARDASLRSAPPRRFLASGPCFRGRMDGICPT